MASGSRQLASQYDDLRAGCPLGRNDVERTVDHGQLTIWRDHADVVGSIFTRPIACTTGMPVDG
jgi:hypothetical protein